MDEVRVDGKGPVPIDPRPGVCGGRGRRVAVPAVATAAAPRCQPVTHAPAYTHGRTERVSAPVHVSNTHAIHMYLRSKCTHGNCARDTHTRTRTRTHVRRILFSRTGGGVCVCRRPAVSSRRRATCSLHTTLL